VGVADYFRKVASATPAELREFLATHGPEEYSLVDVRSPREYERGHLPGARLIPLDELRERAKELDRAKRTYTY
jgi:rhodanese-related sulfurtransferase